MSIDVELDGDDYNAVIDWFSKLFGPKNNHSVQDYKTYLKLCVMAQQWSDDEKFLAKMDEK